MSIVRSIAASIILICLTGVAAMGFEPMTATIRVSNGSLYDYVVIGEHPKATDGYDNAYDTVSPGNLNADMGEPYISAIIFHPDWKRSLQKLRGDIRSPAKSQEWHMFISSSLPAGTPLTVALLADRTEMPKGMKLVIRDGKGWEARVGASGTTYPAPKPGTGAELAIIAEQP